MIAVRRAQRTRWTRRAIAFALVSTSITVGAPSLAHAQTPDHDGSNAIIVQSSSVDAAAHAVEAAGAHVTLYLDAVNGVAASVDADALATLGQDAGVRVAPDATLHPTGLSFGPEAASPQVAATDPAANWGSDAGRGVGVALIDTGVADTPDLQGRLVRAADFSGDNDGIDHYGHGTFVAGLIAGDGAASAASGARRVTGVAPGATIVSLKVAGADGSTSISRVIAAIGFAIQHADTYDIGVMNLSFSADMPVPYVANPLDAAVERAWAAGITVVAAAGNSGSTGVTSPGDDPYVITAGASDTHGTASTADDTVPSWSGRESFRTYAKPDIVAPGVSDISLRAPGSTIDTTHPEGRVDNSYFRGTGTSMSTGMVAGAAAVLLYRNPEATPDDVKGALLDGASTTADGANAVDLDAAAATTARPGWWQHFHIAMGGLGPGLEDGMPWTSGRWNGDQWVSSRWGSARWGSSRWGSSRWGSSRWGSARWGSARWGSARWSSGRWADIGLAGESWASGRWASGRWAATTWPSEGWG